MDLRALPTVLSTSFVDVPGTGEVLTSSVQVSTDTLDYGPDSKQPAAVDILGAIWDDKGKKAGEFKTRLNVTPMSSARGRVGRRAVRRHIQRAHAAHARFLPRQGRRARRARPPDGQRRALGRSA